MEKLILLTMDELSYLRNCNENEILNTWNACGAIVVNKSTKVYNKGTLVRVDASEDDSGLSKSPLHNKIIYVEEDYRVDNKTRGLINWAELSIDDVTGSHAAVQGIQLPYFGILPAKWSATFVPDKDFIPYSDESKVTQSTGGIDISDDELETILTVIGFPFVVFDDVEFSKEQIIKYMIKPAMQRYYTFRPILKDQSLGQYGAGGEFLIEFPEYAYGAVPYYCVPGGNGMAGMGGSPFAFYNEMMMAGGAGTVSTRYGKGLAYPGKRVPGYVGGDRDWRLGQLDSMLANQGLVNVFRREHYRRVKIDGKWYAKGFSSVGGALNVKWLCWSPHWDDILFEDLETIARPMARSEVLRNFAILRGLVKTDIAGQLDPSVLSNERDKIEQALEPIIKSVGISGILAVGRGGGN